MGKFWISNFEFQMDSAIKFEFKKSKLEILWHITSDNFLLDASILMHLQNPKSDHYGNRYTSFRTHRRKAQHSGGTGYHYPAVHFEDQLLEFRPQTL